MESSGPPDLHGLVEAALIGREDAERQRAALAELPPDRAGTLAMRLLAISTYRASKGTKRLEAERLGQALGMTPRGFFQLLQKERTFGPVLGLAPYQRRSLRRSADRDGLHPAAEAALLDALRRGETRFGRIMGDVEAAMSVAKADPPSHDTVRRRIAGLGRTTAPRNLRIGRGLAVVQTMQVFDDAAGATSMTVTFVLDADVLLVLGLGVAPDAADSLRTALSDCVDRAVPALAAAGEPFSDRVEAVDLRLGRELADRALVREAVAKRTDLDDAAFVQAFRRSAGQAILRDGSSVDLRLQAAWLPTAVRVWNARILEGRPRARRDVDGGEALLSEVRAISVGLGRRREAAVQPTSAFD